MTGKLGNILAALLMPLTYANLAGMAVGAIWVITAAQWQLIWIGLMGLIFSPYLIPLVLMPAGICSHLMARYKAQQNTGGERAMFVCSLAYVLLFIAFWSAGIFSYVINHTHPDARHVALLWGATAAMAPLFMWASRDRENLFVTAMVIVAQLAMLVIVGVTALGLHLPLTVMVAVSGGAMALAATAQSVYEKRYMGNGH